MLATLLSRRVSLAHMLDDGVGSVERGQRKGVRAANWNIGLRTARFETSRSETSCVRQTQRKRMAERRKAARQEADVMG